MNEYIQIAYLISSSIAVFAMSSQIRQLVKTKQSDELSLATWATWGCCQVVSFVYATSIHATALMVVNVAWICFYITMVTLIIRYRKRRSLLATILYWMHRGREERQRTPALQARN